MHALFISNPVTINAMLKIVKILATFKQNAEAQISVLNLSNEIPPFNLWKLEEVMLNIQGLVLL